MKFGNRVNTQTLADEVKNVHDLRKVKFNLSRLTGGTKNDVVVIDELKFYIRVSFIDGIIFDLEA